MQLAFQCQYGVIENCKKKKLITIPPNKSAFPCVPSSNVVIDLCFNESQPSSVLSAEVPRITATHPAIQVSVGGDATLQCQATGVPPPLVHWFKGKLRSKAAQTPEEEERVKGPG